MWRQVVPSSTTSFARLLFFRTQASCAALAASLQKALSVCRASAIFVHEGPATPLYVRRCWRARGPTTTPFRNTRIASETIARFAAPNLPVCTARLH